MRLASSEIALKAVAVLDQLPDGLGVSELGRMLGVGPSSAQGALEVLAAEGLIMQPAPRQPYRLDRGHPAAEALVAFACRALPPVEACDIVLRANPAVELAARDRHGYLVVGWRAPCGR